MTCRGPRQVPRLTPPCEESAGCVPSDGAERSADRDVYTRSAGVDAVIIGATLPARQSAADALTSGLRPLGDWVIAGEVSRMINAAVASHVAARRERRAASGASRGGSR